MVVIGQEVSEQLDIVPMQIRVLRHIRPRYGCPDSIHAPVTAPLPPQPLPKSNASPDFLAMLLIVKFIDGLPLARWVIGASQLLQPLHNLMRDTLFEGPFMHIVTFTVIWTKPWCRCSKKKARVRRPIVTCGCKPAARLASRW
ncbi:MAG: IS66 family transposase zinc-finger binding domain-containing protein [Gammaproteobacteria bacterium]